MTTEVMTTEVMTTEETPAAPAPRRGRHMNRKNGKPPRTYSKVSVGTRHLRRADRGGESLKQFARGLALGQSEASLIARAWLEHKASN